MLYSCEFIEENEKNHEKGIVVAEKMSEAVEKLEAYYGDGIDKVLIEDLDDEWFADTDGIVTEEQMRKALRQLNPMQNEVEE
jgi:hypothetical protein